MRADQKIRIIQGVQCITLIFNTVICTLAMKFGAGIHVVKIISTLIFLVNPIVFRIYVKKHYNISKKIFDKNRELPKKRDGMVHHIAFFVHMNTDIVILSVFSGTREVSVYSVYNSIIYTIESFFMAISDGISASIGNLIVKDEKDALNNYFELYQTMNTFLATFFCIAEAILIVPFVSIYTKGVTDADYIRPMFSYIAIAAQWFFCIRIPCSSVINAAGHYRQTSIGAYIEAILNICISLALVRNFGLCGIAFGTAAAMMARTIYMAWYLSKELLFRKMKFFVKDTLLNAAFAIVFVYLAKKTANFAPENIFSWFLYAAAVSVATIVGLVLFNLMLKRREVVFAFKNFRHSGPQ